MRKLVADHHIDERGIAGGKDETEIQVFLGGAGAVTGMNRFHGDLSVSEAVALCHICHKWRNVSLRCPSQKLAVSVAADLEGIADGKLEAASVKAQSFNVGEKQGVPLPEIEESVISVLNLKESAEELFLSDFLLSG